MIDICNIEHDYTNTLREFFSNSFQIEKNTIAVTVFLLIMNETKFRWIHNQKGNCHYDCIPLNLK